ncbi:hypothetical protein CPS_2965 [Colwellia psychrerythraea 34H]|uniref:Uncharacterized protein n=1 Tax=Colwellia psychrerythraea (strain 34H / ATCC BAA-681) TaxID=167879 RepID=Q47ZV4_COLP3|nr:hypothetical protein CPS_2965 [Colwellia psychrerythraea 34H]
MKLTSALRTEESLATVNFERVLYSLLIRKLTFQAKNGRW